MLLKKYYKSILFFVFITFGIFYFIKNLGYFLDVTKEDISSEILLCLGGGRGERIEKTIKLFKKYENEKILIILTEIEQREIEKKLALLEKANIPKKQIIINKDVKSTYDELYFISKYMHENKLTSVNIISDEPHSRRIHMLINNFIDFNSINYSIVGSEVKWWNKEHYYENKRIAIYYVARETLKIVHNYIYYNLLKFIDLDENTRNKLDELEDNFLKFVNKSISYILKITS